MNILLVGAGGREHALARKIAQSPSCHNLFIAPGNAGTSAFGKNIAIQPTDFESLMAFCLEQQIGLVVVGPEEPLVKGIVDRFNATPAVSHIKLIGPAKAGALLEGSKEYAKSFMQRHDIPTAGYGSFTADTIDAGFEFLSRMSSPYVLKADGLAAGKGVLIIDDLATAKSALSDMLQGGRFGQAGATVVVEEFLKGIELSVFVFTDGNSYKILPEAKDYKRIGDGDTGPNTGGMGAVSPVPFADSAFMKKVEDRIVKPTIHGLQSDGIPYTGWIFIGLMNVSGDPYVIEYNVRMGDPETEVVIPRIKSDIVDLFMSAAEGRLQQSELEIDPRTAVTVVLVSGGYPDAYAKGKAVSGLQDVSGSFVYHAGTAVAADGTVVTAGGRVFAVTSMADSLTAAMEKSYDSIRRIAFEGMNYRKDIGKDLQ